MNHSEYLSCICPYIPIRFTRPLLIYLPVPTSIYKYTKIQNLQKLSPNSGGNFLYCPTAIFIFSSHDLV